MSHKHGILISCNNYFIEDGFAERIDVCSACLKNCRLETRPILWKVVFTLCRCGVPFEDGGIFCNSELKKLACYEALFDVVNKSLQ